jgi:hypothetical protein
MHAIFLSLNVVTIGALLLTLIFTAGIVWRVEKELDVSYKFFLLAIVLLILAEIADLYYSIDAAEAVALVVKIARVSFAVFFLIGILFMRDIVRKLDGEKEIEK